MIEFDVRFQNAQDMDVSFSEGDAFSCSMEGVIAGDYSGSYLITPGEEQQTLPTSGKICELDIVVEAIPSNYGRIEYNGSTITVY